MNYLTFLRTERRFLTFGISFTFFSSFGQTFLVSLFVPHFLTAFDLSNAGFGGIYSTATLISAGTLPWIGQLIDRVPLRWFSLAVAVGLATACLLIALSWHLPLFFVAIFLLRLTGQGLSGHTAETAMARFYDDRRGKALSISSLGYPLGEAFLPTLIAGLLTWLHWRTVWGGMAAIILVLFIPMIWLLAGRHNAGKIKPGNRQDSPDSARKSYGIILRDRRIWFLLPAVLMPPFWATGLFLYQVSVASELGWTAGLIATAFIAFAIFRVVGSLLIGPLIDRFSAQGLFPFFLLPMIAGLIVPIFYTPDWVAFLYMGLFGLTMGVGSNITSALWAELFGTEIIGTVRSLFSALMVLGAALSPVLLGALLDWQVPFEWVLGAGVLTSLFATLLSLRVHPLLQKR